MDCCHDWTDCGVRRERRDLGTAGVGDPSADRVVTAVERGLFAIRELRFLTSVDRLLKRVDGVARVVDHRRCHTVPACCAVRTRTPDYRITRANGGRAAGR